MTVMIDVAMLEGICPLGLACEVMSGKMSADCPNQESCYYWAQSWDLYEIVWLKGLPPIFVLSNADYDQWCEGYGFFRFDDKDFLLWYAAKFNGFEAWKAVLNKFESN